MGAVVAVLADAVLGRVTGAEPLNLAFGARTTINDLARRVIATTGVDAQVRHAPAQAADVRDSQTASNRLRQLFPSASHIDLNEGLERTVAWFRKQQSYGKTASIEANQAP